MFLCPRSMFCIVHFLIYALSMFWYLYCSCSGTDIVGHLVLQVIRYQKVLQSTSTCTVIWYLHSHLIPMLHVIWYPHSMSSDTTFVFIRYQLSTSSGTSFIQYQIMPIPVLAPSSTTIALV
jgi:hypothetical protein